MKKLLLLLLLPIGALAQETRWWEGKIISTTNKEAVSFATVASYPVFRVSSADEAGQARFSYALTDTIKVFCLGFESRMVLGSQLVNLPEITLKPVVFQLNEVQVRNKVMTEWWGTTKKRTRFGLSLIPGAKLALFIPNNGAKEGTISKVRYFLTNFGRDGGFRIPFRVQLYTVGRKGEPDKLLLKDVVMVQAVHSGWTEVDISQYQVALPTEGFFIGMEFLSKEEYDYQTEKITVKQKDGTKTKENRLIQVTVGIGEDKDGIENTWMNMKTVWMKKSLNGVIMQGKNAMMGAEITF
ncbi:MAG: hypothetical protein LCH91_13370 [Bacteroidetes bacterium]|nr:hypothetical protein [Bacteroidota bacterium]